LVAQAAAMNSPEFARLVHEVKSYNIWFTDVGFDKKTRAMSLDDRKELTQNKINHLQQIAWCAIPPSLASCGVPLNVFVCPPSVG
jgi:hypothetical protein